MKEKMIMMAFGAWLLVGCDPGETNAGVQEFEPLPTLNDCGYVDDIEQMLPEPFILYTPKACCMALTAECLACAEGITVEEWNEKNG